MGSTSQWIAALTEQTDVTLAARVLGCHLAARRATWSTGAGIWCSVGTMCRHTGLSRATVHRALSALLEGGWIRQTQATPGRPSHYDLCLERAGGVGATQGEDEGGTEETGGCLTSETPPLGSETVERSVEGPVEGPVGSCGKLWTDIGPCRTGETGGYLTGETGGVSPVRHKLSTKHTQKLLEEEVASKEHDGGVDLPREGERDAGAPPPASDRQTSTQGERDDDEQAEHTPAPAPVSMEGGGLERIAYLRSVLLRDDDEWVSREDMASTRARLRDLEPLVPDHYQEAPQGIVCWAVSTWLYRWQGVPLAVGTWTVLLQPVLSNMSDDDALDYILWQIVDESAREPVDWTCNADVQRVWVSVRSGRARQRWRAEIHRKRTHRGADWRSDDGNDARWARNVTHVLRALRALGLDGAHTHTRSTP